VTEPRDASAPTVAPSGGPAVGRLISGRYRLGPVIGRGGMATIHRATDTRLDRRVAVKLLRPEIGADPDLAQRFRGEALAATVLRHANIVECLDTGTDGDQPYLVMELVEGEDLAARLRRGGRLAPHEAARIGLDVARAIGVAHLRGIVHRDIKPANVMLAADGRAMVTDFGIARLAADREASLPGTTLGSVHYFSPEQARGLTTTPASDVYGLGLVLYEALTGQRAWSGDTTDAIALARIDAPAPSPRAIRPEVPPEFDAVVMRAMAPDPADRYPNGATIATALESVVAATDPAGATAVVTLPRPGARSNGDGAPPVEPPSPARPARQPVRPSRGKSKGKAPVAGRRGGPPRSGRGTAAKASLASPRRNLRAVRPGALIALLAVAGVVGGAVTVASLSGSNSLAIVPPVTARPSATPRPTPRPTPKPTATPTRAPTPTPAAQPSALLAGEVAALCEVYLDLPCGLGAGRYAVTDLTPTFEIEVGDGWSVSVRSRDVVALVRPEGVATYATGAQALDRDGKPTETKGHARDLISAFSALAGVDSTKGANVRIDGRRGRSVDLTASRGKRIALFRTEHTTYFLEPGRTTRIVALDTDEEGVLVIAIEPAKDHDLKDILATADALAGSTRFR